MLSLFNFSLTRTHFSSFTDMSAPRTSRAPLECPVPALLRQRMHRARRCPASQVADVRPADPREVHTSRVLPPRILHKGSARDPSPRPESKRVCHAEPFHELCDAKGVWGVVAALCWRRHFLSNLSQGLSLMWKLAAGCRSDCGGRPGLRSRGNVSVFPSYARRPTRLRLQRMIRKGFCIAVQPAWEGEHLAIISVGSSERARGMKPGMKELMTLWTSTRRDTHALT